MTDSLLQRKARLFSTLTLVHFFLLLLLLVVWHVFVMPSPTSTKNTLIILNLHLIPLLAFLPGLLRQKQRVYIWLCFFLLLYFCQGVINAFALPHVTGVLGLLETLLTSGLFTSAMMAARYLAQLQAPQQKQ